MRLRRIDSLIQGARSRRAPFGGLILMYHRIAEARTDPWELCVTPERFEEHLEVVCRLGTPLPVAEFARLAAAGQAPANAVALTFDDGYFDNLAVALPLLQRFGVPATVFVATGFIGEGQVFWWDLLEHLLLHPGRLPEDLYLDVHGIRLNWHLGEAARYDASAFARYRAWTYRIPPPTPRHALFLALWDLLAGLAPELRPAVVQELVRWAGGYEPPDSFCRCMSREEIRELAQAPLIQIGAHTVSHPRLDTLPLADQQREIAESRRGLEVLLGRTVEGFSYPYGRFTPDTVECVAETGFRYACRTARGLVDAHSALSGARGLELPRLPVANWRGREFRRRLRSRAADGI